MEKKELPWGSIFMRGIITGGVFLADLLIVFFTSIQTGDENYYIVFCYYILPWLTMAAASLVLVRRGNRYWWCSYLLAVLIWLFLALLVSPPPQDYIDTNPYYCEDLRAFTCFKLAFVFSIPAVLFTPIATLFARSWQEN